jgi:hypothetical protein
MALVTVNPGFARAVDGASPKASKDFGIVRRLFAFDGEPLQDGRTGDVARINQSASYSVPRFVGAVQALILDDLRKLCEGEDGIEYPEQVYAVDYMIGAVDADGIISNYATISVTDPESYQDERQEIELIIQYELMRGAVQGSNAEGLTTVFEGYFQPPSIPPSTLKL